MCLDPEELASAFLAIFFFFFFFARVSALGDKVTVHTLFMHCSHTVHALFMRPTTTLFRKKNFKIGPTTLFTYLKIILL